MNTLSLEETRRNLIDTAFRGLLAVALYLAFPAFSDIYRLWERTAGNPDFTAIPFEYPPVSALYFEPLTLLPSSSWAVAVNGLVMVGAAVGITWLLIHKVESSFGGVDVRMWAASPALLLLLPINWDVLVTLALLLGVVALYQQRELVSGAWHGIGTAFKVFPGAVVLPVLPLISSWRHRLKFLAAGLVALAGSYGIYALVEPDDWRFHLDFASIRTDTQSSLWGVVDGVLGFFGTSLSTGTVNLLSSVGIVAALVAVTLWAHYRRPSFAEVATVAVVALLVFNKVFKPQYVLWVVPLFAWIGASRVKVRLVEATAIAQFVVIYLTLPAFLYPLIASIRVATLGLLAREVIKSRVARGAPR